MAINGQESTEVTVALLEDRVGSLVGDHLIWIASSTDLINILLKEHAYNSALRQNEALQSSSTQLYEQVCRDLAVSMALSHGA